MATADWTATVNLEVPAARAAKKQITDVGTEMTQVASMAGAEAVVDANVYNDECMTEEDVSNKVKTVLRESEEGLQRMRQTFVKLVFKEFKEVVEPRMDRSGRGRSRIRRRTWRWRRRTWSTAPR